MVVEFRSRGVRRAETLVTVKQTALDALRCSYQVVARGTNQLFDILYNMTPSLSGSMCRVITILAKEILALLALYDG
jgi:hypothetical protein